MKDVCTNTCSCRRCQPYYVDKKRMTVDVMVERADGSRYLTNVHDVRSEQEARKRVERWLTEGKVVGTNVVGYVKVWR